MDKFMASLMLFVIIVTVGYFGQKLGYSVDGVPKGEHDTEPTVTTVKIGDVPFFDYEPTITVTDDNDLLDTMMRSVEYLYDFASFRIDNVPDWLTLVVDFICFIAIVVIYLMVRGS